MNIHRNAAAKTPKRKPRQLNGPVESIVVDRRVWKEALRLAEGNPRRLRIVDEKTVVVN
jgi:hypothetical protein